MNAAQEQFLNGNAKQQDKKPEIDEIYEELRSHHKDKLCDNIDGAVDLDPEDDNLQLTNAEVVAVSNLEVTLICFSCNGNVKKIDDHV